MNNRRQLENNRREQQERWGKRRPQQPRALIKQPPKLEARRRLSQPPEQLSLPKSIVRPKSNRQIERSPEVKSSGDLRKRRREYNRLRITTVEAVDSTSRGTTSARASKGQSYPLSLQRQRNQKPRRPAKRPVSSLVYIIRMVIVGIGIGAIAGTLLSTLNPSNNTPEKANDAAQTEVQENSTPVSTAPTPQLQQEIPTLKTEMQALVARNPNLQPGVFIIDLDTGAYLDWQGNSIFPAASTIKVPILVAFFQDVDAGKIRLDEPLILQEDLIAGGSGTLRYQKPGTEYTALEVATKMITISDNTATNMIIARLGGSNALNQRFASWDLKATVIRNPLPDVEGTNTTSPRDLANLMSLVNQGKLMSLRSRDRLLDIMQQTRTNTMLPQGLGAGATIAHKTGTIGSLLADVGLVDMPNGKRYIVVAMVKRPHNDNSARELIRQISSVTYEYFNQPRAIPSTTSMPSDNTAILSRIPTCDAPTLT
ncbi:MAG: serine hydrolase [Symploca sp. SIO1A3]|nr:serine hydrolase [Symploca sp. SIO2C1]NER52894.1 serine hydrolase [Symploca sp. SIO1A3]